MNTSHRHFRLLLILTIVCMLCLCASVVSTSAQTPVTFTPIFLIVTNTFTPTAAVSPIYLIVTATLTPQYLIVTSTPVPPTPLNSATAEARLTLAVVASYQEHFIFRRPFADDYQTYWARNYAYGSTDNGKLRVHHGIDISNPPGTPVLAAAGGMVYYAGKDVAVLFGPQPNFYGNVVVIEHPITDVSGGKVYSLYGHLERIDVAPGQVVQAAQTIGIVGATGIAAGTHLHFEVRVGNPTDYLSTRNPELWTQPYLYRGVIAGRAVDENGVPLLGVRVEAQSDTGYQFAYTYGNTEVNGDTTLDENFVIPDLPEGNYRVFVRQPELNYYGQGRVEVRAGRTSWVEFKVVRQ